MRSVRIRQPVNSDADFDVVVTDPIVGSFALNSDFEIDVHDSDSSWKRVSLEELKAILKRKNLRVDDLPTASEIAECRLFARVDDIEIPYWERSRLSGRGREEACVRYVQKILYRVGIPHVVAGTTFTVPSALTARIPLKRAGFRQSRISRSALVEPRTNVAIQLIERDQCR
jgi:hypothetical protein